MISETDILNASILIVDNQAFNVDMLNQILKGAGYTSVESTTNLPNVCNLYRNARYSLILLDIEMPGMDGFQVLDGLRDAEPDDYIPVIVIADQPYYKLLALNIGAKDVIGTPFDRDDVLARVRNILEVRLLHEESKRHIKALEQELQEMDVGQTLGGMQNQSAERWL